MTSPLPGRHGNRLRACPPGAGFPALVVASLLVLLWFDPKTVPAGEDGVASAATSEKQTAYIAGKSYFYGDKYIEYTAGNLPIILVAPHGGRLQPAQLPDLPRHRGADNKSQEYTREAMEHLQRLSHGGYPHLIIVNLHPGKLNAVRPIDEAAGRHPDTRKAWEAFHQFITDAKQHITRNWRRGHYFEMHTNGHRERWVEIGVGLSRRYLNQPDAKADMLAWARRSTIRSLGSSPGVDFLEVLRGQTSLGGLLEARGYRVVPSPQNPGPRDGGFFFAGYNTWLHGSHRDGTVDATHIETHFCYLINPKTRHKYSRDLAESIKVFVERHYDVQLTDWRRHQRDTP